MMTSETSLEANINQHVKDEGTDMNRIGFISSGLNV